MRQSFVIFADTNRILKMSEGASAKDEGAPEHINLKVYNSVMGIRLIQEN